MLTRLSRKLRWRAALAAAVLYSVCGIAPSLALALAETAKAVHCVTEDHGGNIHAHNDGHGLGSHDNNTDAASTAGDVEKDKDAPGNCCGIFCLTALPASDHPAISVFSHGSMVIPMLQHGLATAGPDRINRPPIV